MDQDILIPPMGDQTLLKWCMEAHSCENTDVDYFLKTKHSPEMVIQTENTHEIRVSDLPPISPMLIDTEETEVEHARRITEENKIILEYVGNEIVNELTNSFINEVADEEELAYQKRILMLGLLEGKISKAKILEVEASIDNGEEELGLAKTLDIIDSPNYAKEVKRRGRKSIVELISKAGKAEGQTTLTNLFHAGKGKILHKEK